MMTFLRALVTSYYSIKTTPMYDEDGSYIDPKVGVLNDKELTVTAENARIMMSKAVEYVKLKERRKVFQRIHVAIKQGKTKIRLESYQATPETLTYFSELGYVVTTTTPPNTGGTLAMPPSMFDDEDDETSNAPYHYYTLSWGTETASVGEVSQTAEAVAALTTLG